MSLDIDRARSARPYSRREYLGRVLWALATPLFHWSPRPLFGWRNMLLRVFGAKVGRGVHVDPGARIEIPWMLTLGDHAAIGAGVWVYNLGPIRIGARATVSHRAHLCGGSHDYADPTLPLLRTGLVVGEDAWICSDAFVGPGVAVGEGAVVGAAAVVTRDVEPWRVVAGNPARVVKQRVMRDAASP
ncbi:MAG: putative colanic acid biosynthesis acetyltransferase [Proteobacteria bacterium]|nr:putative colanic acid biosynthesis acetyltransferase [Pseudomonadota bacterium]